MPPKHRSLRGQLLLDGGKLQGSFFHRTVVLICQHDLEGAFGLVLNRSSEKTVAELIPEEMPVGLGKLDVFLGGPVQPSTLSYIHRVEAPASGDVLPEISLGHSLEEMVALARRPMIARRIKVFAGYAGWSPGQLDEEIKRGAWLTHPASASLVFESDPESLWKQILRSMGWQYSLLADAPEDLSDN